MSGSFNGISSKTTATPAAKVNDTAAAAREVAVHAHTRVDEVLDNQDAINADLYACLSLAQHDISDIHNQLFGLDQDLKARSASLWADLEHRVDGVEKANQARAKEYTTMLLNDAAAIGNINKRLESAAGSLNELKEKIETRERVQNAWTHYFSDSLNAVDDKINGIDIMTWPQVILLSCLSTGVMGFLTLALYLWAK